MIEPLPVSPKIGPEEAVSLARQYPVDEDREPLLAGAAIRDRGDFTRDNLAKIFKWKTRDRGKSRLLRNQDAEIEEALRLATGAIHPRTAISVLRGLDGVEVPVASAVMTMIYPNRYTVIDFRALETLGVEQSFPTVTYYLAYLHRCQIIAKDWCLSLRELDRALWQWSVNNDSGLSNT